MYGRNYTPSPEPQYYENESISLGEEKLEILFVPGHSPGHVAFYSSTNRLLISGDVLFKQSIGRTDLPCGNMEVLMNSFVDILIPLPNES